MRRLPEFLRPYFWETDFAGLRLPEQQSYVIERVLEYGDDRAIHWLKATFEPETIAEVVRHSRRISRNTANSMGAGAGYSQGANPMFLDTLPANARQLLT